VILDLNHHRYRLVIVVQCGLSVIYAHLVTPILNVLLGMDTNYVQLFLLA